MAQIQFLNKSEKIHVVLLGCCLGMLLANGYSATSISLATRLFNFINLDLSSTSINFIGTVGLAFLLFISIPVSKKDETVFTWPTWYRTVPMALFISFMFGLFVPGNILNISRPELLWVVVVAPLTEELLFRGWVYALFMRLWKHSLLSITNPMPAATWGSAIAFALWHLQNLGALSVGFVIFQILYTFVLGIWFSTVRHRQQSITAPIITHMLLNLASVLC